MSQTPLDYARVLKGLDSPDLALRTACVEELSSGDATYDQALQYLINPDNSEVALVIDKIGDFNVILGTVYSKLIQHAAKDRHKEYVDSASCILESLWDDIHAVGGENIKFSNLSDFKQFIESNQFPFDTIFSLVQIDLRNMVVKSLCDESPLAGDDAYSVVLKGLWQHLYAKSDENQSYRCLDGGVTSGEDFGMADIDWM